MPRYLRNGALEFSFTQKSFPHHTGRNIFRVGFWGLPRRPVLRYSSKFAHRVPKWRNWQTRQIQGLVWATTWGFKSPLRHQQTQGLAGFDPPALFLVVPHLGPIWDRWFSRSTREASRSLSACAPGSGERTAASRFRVRQPLVFVGEFIQGNGAHLPGEPLPLPRSSRCTRCRRASRQLLIRPLPPA